MVRSESVIVWAGVAPVKVAEIDIEFFRLPYATDEELKQGALEQCNQAFLDQGEPTLTALNPRLTKINNFSWKATVDVTDEGAPRASTIPPVQGLDPVTWGLIMYLIAGILIGWLVTKWIIYLVRVRPMEQALQEVVTTLDDVIADKHARLAAGEISQAYSDELDAILEQARDDADAAGDDPQLNWMDYLARVLELGKYIPWIVGGIIGLSVLATVRAFAPRR